MHPKERLVNQERKATCAKTGQVKMDAWALLAPVHILETMQTTTLGFP